jgi:hypothetical protein
MREIGMGPKGRWKKEFGLLGLLLLIDSMLAVVAARVLPFYYPNGEYMVDAVIFAAKHRIDNTFLPVAYSGLLGLGLWWNGQSGVVVVSVGLSLLMIVAAWFYLRNLGTPVGTTFLIAALLSIYPDFVLSLHKARDTEITELLIFAFAMFLMKAMNDDRLGWADVGLALTLGCAVLVRSNLLLLVFLAWFVFWRLRVPKAMVRSVAQLLIVVACYVLVTTAFHGKPFLPRNGPYNLYSGFNEFTQDHPNEEDSLFAALPAHHIPPPDGASSFTSWNQRDPSLDPIYTHLALQFMREHPGRAVGLVGVKFWNFMRPYTEQHPARSVGGAFKILEALAIPLWLVVLVVLPHPGPRGTKLMLLLMVACYVLPFLLTVSSPRFRAPLDVFCWVDIGAVLAAWRMRSAARDGVETRVVAASSLAGN